jgi:hypothetical protein
MSPLLLLRSDFLKHRLATENLKWRSRHQRPMSLTERCFKAMLLCSRCTLRVVWWILRDYRDAPAVSVLSSIVWSLEVLRVISDIESVLRAFFLLSSPTVIPNPSCKLQKRVFWCFVSQNRSQNSRAATQRLLWRRRTEARAKELERTWHDANVRDTTRPTRREFAKKW